MSGLRERMNRLLGAPKPQRELSPEADEDATGPAAGKVADRIVERQSADGGAATVGSWPPTAHETAATAEVEALAPAMDTSDESSAPDRSDADTLRQPEECPQSEATAALEPGWLALGVEPLVHAGETFLRRRLIYPLDHRHGDQRLAELHETAHELAAFHPTLPEPEPGEILFLDLETTGLGAGTGTIPFMVGIGYMEATQFVIEQLFIRHPAEERAMLSYLHDWLSRRRFLATYNGKTFDWPALSGRYVMHGWRSGLTAPLHLDFLHPSRSIWRHTLDSCKLSRVEEARLGIHRTDDVPGAMAPALYYQYLADGDPLPLAAVFRHNEIDMLSLAALAIRYGRLLGGALGSELPYPEQPEEQLRTGLWLERMGKTADAELLYDRLMASEEPPGDWCLLLAARDKKVGNWERAVVLWQKAAHLAETTSSPITEAHIELAMYHEHRTKDLAKALHYAKLAFAMSGGASAPRKGPKPQDRETIRKRVERLLTKVERNK